MTNPLLEVFPPIDFTFGIGDIVGSIALLVSAFTFYISYTQASQSEQIKTSRDIWANIVEKFDELFKQLDKEGYEKMIDEELVKQQRNKEYQYEIGKAYDEQREALDKKTRPLFEEIDYFAYLILSGEVKDKVVLGYYKSKLVYLFLTVHDRTFKVHHMVGGTDLNLLYFRFPHLKRLIEEWKILRIPKIHRGWDNSRNP